MTTRRSEVLLQVLRNALTLASTVLFYYFVPVRLDEPHPIFAVVVFVVSLAVLIWLIVEQLRKQMAAGPNPGVRLRTLLTLLYPVVVLFALTYYVIQSASPTQFDGLVTRTDSLYFTVVTLGTVGYGDFHPAGQLARWLTTVQIAFDLVVIGALIAVAGSRFQVVTRPRQSGETGTPPEPSA